MAEAVIPRIPQGRSARAEFASERRDFFRLVRRGATLELITAGFYRFWLATDMRRMLWSGTFIEDDAAEYTGTAKELLIGFLFAIAILAPIYLVYFLIGIEVERAKAFASIPLILFFYAFGQFAIFRARRYRATRTVWRGVRFWMSGSGWAYSWRACLWSLLALVTLGLAFPWRESALERYKMRHLHYGDLPGRFEGTGWNLFKHGCWIWLSVLGVVVLAFVFRTHPVVKVLPFLLIIAGPFIFAAYKAIVWRWWLSGIRFGEVRFESDLRVGALMGLYWATIGWMLLIVIVGAAVIGLVDVSMPVLFGGHFGGAAVKPLARAHPYIMAGANILLYLMFVLAAGIVVRVYLLRGVWERVVNSASVYNLDFAEGVRAQGNLVSALGEGFADGLDVVGF
ncbi:MAG: DUF898 family protein [Xanthobacteraceae bacterium]